MSGFGGGGSAFLNAAPAPGSALASDSCRATSFQPPAPYRSPEPFEPYAIAAVELAEERMVVLGQVVPGVDLADMRAGMPVELVLHPLYEDDEHEYLVWKWQPVVAGTAIETETETETGEPS